MARGTPLVLGIALLQVASVAHALTLGCDGCGVAGTAGPGTAMLREKSAVLIYQCREGDAGFANCIPIYEAALVAAGAIVSWVDAPTGGGAFPANYNPTNYPVTFVLTGEDWWAPSFPPNDEQTVAAYLDAGGSLFFSGQDYLYGAGYPDGPLSGFPLKIGVGQVLQDAPFGTKSMEVVGRGIFDGIVLTLDSSACFSNNPFYPDDLSPCAGAAGLLVQTDPEQHLGATIYATDTYRSIFTTIELAGDTSNQFDTLVGTAWNWLKSGPTPARSTSWGALKAGFR